MASPTLAPAARRRLVLGLLLGLLALAPASLAEDVVPLRRVLMNPDRLPKEMERLKQGVLVQLPRAEFEERLHQAQRAADTLKCPPRFTETRYHAILSDSALVGGARWHILPCRSRAQSAAAAIPEPGLARSACAASKVRRRWVNSTARRRRCS